MLDGDKVAKFTNCLFESYEKCRGKAVKSIPDFLFWDVVVLTTGDAEQQRVFEMQLESKRSRGELPTDVPFHVFSDPPNTKTGNGGATINSLAELESIYKERLSSMRVLLIHAGGQSKRLPCASIMGKIFTAIPVGPHISDMLDLNLAMFLPFLKKMQPGVFVTCSDVILPYFLDCGGDWSFELPGFTVLAHPSSIEIATKHGVYVLKDAGAALQKSVGTFQCLKVLQKPCEKDIRENGAIVEKNGEEFVFTDSVFFFDHNVSSRLLRFHADCGPITCEIDGYGDFLQALGPLANSDYINNTSNVSYVKPELLNMRLKVFDLLKCLPLNTTVLNDSKFYHLGTMQEYVTNFCEDMTLCKVMNFKRSAFSKVVQDRSNIPGSVEGSILHSVVISSSVIPEISVVEFCHFDIPFKIGENSIISNCEYISNLQGDSNLKCDGKILEIPSNTFIHTVPIKLGSDTFYITIMCSTGDDLKASTLKNEVDELKYFGHDFTKVLDAWGRSVDDIFPKTETCSLWRARLFPALPNMSQALVASLSLLSDLADSGPKFQIPSDTVWLSMADMMTMKDVSGMLEYRNLLHGVIKASLLSEI
ncbi:fucose-1-phosphate guanylyltransferase-like [Lineus longissimus]|uniref:fucose-1-phosphate guanylyltransferase-like n=1 Tax=Lineus longissimus TaxID=88925 RepID=UPI002B4DF74A